MGSFPFPSSNLSNYCSFSRDLCSGLWLFSPILVLPFRLFLHEAQHGRDSFFIFTQRTLHSVAQPSEPCWWFTGNDASYWERSSFPGATTFSKMAFILNWLITVFLACLIWHGYSLKQLFEEPRGAPALAASAVARICSPEAAAKEGANTKHWRVFPLLLLPVVCKMTLHTWLWDLCLYIFLSQLE